MEIQHDPYHDGSNFYLPKKEKQCILHQFVQFENDEPLPIPGNLFFFFSLREKCKGFHMEMTCSMEKM